MEVCQLVLPCLLDGNRFDGVKLGRQGIKEQRVNNLMDILNAGVVHTAAATGFGVQGAFKDCTEDGGGNLGPVEILAGIGQQQVNDFLSELGDNDILVSEQTTVDVRESCQIIIHIRVAVCHLGVQHTKQVNECLTDIFRLEAFQVVVEHGLAAKDTSIFGI